LSHNVETNAIEPIDKVQKKEEERLMDNPTTHKAKIPKITIACDSDAQRSRFVRAARRADKSVAKWAREVLEREARGHAVTD
jgi:hypothetical protein